ncbi:MAG: DNA primase [Steroidobacteraceae bacterium]
MSAARLLDRLKCVKQRAPDRWLARCPAHPDRNPSLSVRELEDGRLLVHDFGGCQVSDVLQAVGLTFSDLFPKPLRSVGTDSGQSSTNLCIPARDLLEIISEETSIVAILAADLLDGRSIGTRDWQRLALAAARIHRVRDHAYGR